MKKHEFLRSAFTSLEAVDLSKNTNNGFAFTFLKPERWRENSKSETQIKIESEILF